MPERFTMTDRRWLVAWFLLALLIRGAAVGALAGMLPKDNDGYARLAVNLVEHGVYGFQRDGTLQPTAFRPPLYPLLLTTTVGDGVVIVSRVAILHVLLGAATVACVWQAARWMGLGGMSHAAALIVAVDPILLIQSAQLMTETLATLLAAAALLTLMFAARAGLRWPWALAGLTLGLACLCRPTFLLSAGLIGLFTLGGGVRDRRSLQALGLLLAAAAAPVVCWTARNAIVMGRPIVATTHGGYTMLLGNNADYYAHLRIRKDIGVWRADQLDARLAVRRETEQLSELQYDQLTADEAMRTINADPRGFVRAASHRIARLFGVLPRRTDDQESDRRRWARYAVAGWYVLVLGLAALGLVLNSFRGPPFQDDVNPADAAEVEGAHAAASAANWAWLWMLAFVISFVLLHVVYWCDMRMRAPLTPFIALAAASAISRSRWGSGRSA